MAIINITSDSDGTLHSAALHNDKFAVVQNVINGNIEHANLKYPNSIVEWSADTFVIPYEGPSAPAGGAESFVAGFAAADFNAPTVQWAYDTAGSESNYITNSLRKTDRAYKFLVTDIWWQSYPMHGTGGDFVAYFEYADTNDATIGDWTTIFSVSLAQPLSQTSVPQEHQGTANTSIASGKYFRIRVQQASGYNEPGDGPDLPEIHVKMLMATQHVA